MKVLTNTATSKDENASLKHIKATLDVSTFVYMEDVKTQTDPQ